ncbi:MAG: hypothetical protein ACR652_11580 [Methylocystis sp.]|uniref:hypothetical protein n=1 Tax=Methylocystis sp. TaxID=1911079 RepID=UPI003DA1DD8C
MAEGMSSVTLSVQNFYVNIEKGIFIPFMLMGSLHPDKLGDKFRREPIVVAHRALNIDALANRLTRSAKSSPPEIRPSSGELVPEIRTVT